MYLVVIESPDGTFCQVQVHCGSLRGATAGKAPKAWALPRFWVSTRSYKKQSVKKISSLCHSGTAKKKYQLKNCAQFYPKWVAQFSSDPYPIIVYSCHLPTQLSDVV